MRRTLHAVAVALGGSSLVACAALTGLDDITESACAPDGCNDASTHADAKGSADGSGGDGPAATPDTGDGGGVDASSGRDTGSGAVDTGAADTVAADTVTADMSAADTSAAEASVDSGADVAPDAPADSTPAHDAASDGPCGTVYFSDSFGSADGGWTLGTAWSIAPTCANPPTPQKGNPDPTVDHTTGVAGGVAGVFVCGDNPSGTTSAVSYATSPAVDVSAAPSLVLGFYRWLNSDADGWMASTVDVYDGTTWVNVYTNPSGSGDVVADSAWTKMEYDVTAQKNAAFRVRFGFAVTNTAVYSMSCWNVDDVTLSTVACP